MTKTNVVPMTDRTPKAGDDFETQIEARGDNPVSWYEGTLTVQEPAWSNAIGIGKFGLSQFLAEQAALASATERKVSPGTLDYFTAGMMEMAPADPIEAMLSMQMLATHKTFMEGARGVKSREAIKSMNELARTFSVQADTLKRYRCKDPRSINIKNMTVEEGGQAIVGSVTAPARKDEPNS